MEISERGKDLSSSHLGHTMVTWEEARGNGWKYTGRTERRHLFRQDKQFCAFTKKRLRTENRTLSSQEVSEKRRKICVVLVEEKVLLS